MLRKGFWKRGIAIVVFGSVICVAYVASGQNSSIRVVRPAVSGLLQDPTDESPGLFGNWINRLESLRDRIDAFLTFREELNLTDEQLESLKTLKGYCRDEMKTVMQLRKDLIGQVLDPEPKEAVIRLTAAELGQAIGDAAVKASQLAVEVRQILTPEQLALVKEFIEARQAHIQERIDELKDKHASNEE